MKLPVLLLVGGLPLTMIGTSNAFEASNPPQPLLQLAQNDEACPEGEECLTDRQKRRQQRQERQQRQQQEQQQQGEQTQEAQPEQAAPEQGETAEERRKRRQERQRAQEQQQQQDQQQQETQEAQPVEGSEPAQGETAEQRRQRRQQRQQAQDQQQQDADQQAQDVEQAEEGESTVEQQLEAQGDREQARKVRDLRNRMLREMRQDEQEQANEAGEQRRRLPWDRDQVVERRGDRVIIDLGGRITIRSSVPDDASRLLYGANNVDVRQLENGRTQTIVTRADGVSIVTTRDRFGNIIRRIKRLPNGTDILLIDNRFPQGYDPRRPPILIDVRPVRINMPRERYIVDLGRASYEDIRGALIAPPVEPIQRAYTLDEVLWNEGVRAYAPRIDLDTISFEFGSSTIGTDQMQALDQLGRAMEDVLAEQPDEVYLIEGHTDAVGSDEDNLILSDERAEAVATALSQNYDIPPENLITQGYGEQYLKVNTEGPERANRRATVRRVTELLQAQN